MNSKSSRHRLISRLLAGHSVANQQQLVELLAVHHMKTTRATVSRDLHDLGAIKVRKHGGKNVYVIPDQSTGDLPLKGDSKERAQQHLRSIFNTWMIDAVSSGNIVVIHTPPGSAHVVASALDQADLREVLGTVAGDDTVLVVVVDATAAVRLVERLRRLAASADMVTPGFAHDREENPST
ncbi:MAG: arginine repressor [Acidimicrobiaceae bacterium]|nr:arginine repressor [Acidimicrobiaceae bacterium]